MRVYLIAFSLFVFYNPTFVSSLESSPDVWSYRCQKPEGKCVRAYADTTNTAPFMTFKTCQLTCGEFGTLWPRPKMATLGNEVIYFVPSNIVLAATVCAGNVCNLLNSAFAIALTTIDKYHPDFGTTSNLWSQPNVPNINKHKVILKINITGTEEHLVLTTDESYKLEVTTTGPETNVAISAPTFFGARHALETFTQLMDFDDNSKSLQIVTSALIDDRPEFPYRGLIIDTARNFIPVSNLKKVMDAMSYNKLNTFHWHLSDTQSWPIEIKAYPQMVKYGTHSPNAHYTQSEIKNLVQYAQVRGIRVLPELDAPAHVGHGWNWGDTAGLGNLVVCLDKQPWTSYCVGAPCGQMNLANPNLYTVLEAVYSEIAEMFSPIDMFHYGGDEVHLNCWNTSSEMTDWMTSSGFGLTADAYYQQWSVYQEKARQLLTKGNKGKEVPGIIWTSSLTEEGRSDRYLDKSKYIIQIWTTGEDKLIGELLTKGFNVIFSNYDAFYLDCGVSSWVSNGTNWCSPYKGWQDVYGNDIKHIAQKQTGSIKHAEQILGGEATAWSEQIDENTLDAKLWPRGAALAERLWTNPSETYVSAENRMLQHRQRLVNRGIHAARLQPEWCRLNQGECVLPPTKTDASVAT